ncbi:MAG TPA: anaerobic sulfatase maturase [Anaerohalosphaeraceae bacterium]|nr:anaerobic sulfatase maturase [Anaerohalosphaeraceae bacterium]HOL88983.1 anaerobic sulfatase maturase [Anaerohalosphaeraceae bacterium]HPP57362.1 anaerobic sulfatase maturase [Anaerohalosphaeraceae bacterium]
MVQPFTLLIKPAGPDCNLACRYCFYTPKKTLFPDSPCRMSEAVLETLCKQYFQLRFPMNAFAWQGGEPTLMGLDFYKKAVHFQAQYRTQEQSVQNTFQTNAVLIDDNWCRFFAEHNFLLGISLDGPQEIHDFYRKDHAGRGTYSRVLRAIDCCRKAAVEFNILVLLSDRNITEPDLLFDFFTAQGFTFLQLVPCFEIDPDNPPQPASWSITAEQYGRFLCRFFDRWRDGWTERLSVRTFDNFINVLAGGPPAECIFGRLCSDYLVIEHDGSAYCCDFFVTPETRLGSLLDTPLEQLAASPVKQNFIRRKRRIADSCLVCRYLDLCGGGCLKDRIPLTGTEKTPSYFCRAYKMFLDHALPHLRALAASAVQKLRKQPSSAKR